ncbi:MAG TPA: hypothetical protein VJT50_16095 [Pyrinomonadaceae bacterium]|nr:hypothetical protein [Pyrinomonadaceae bacterium]
MRFCLDDGTALRPVHDVDETLIIPATPASAQKLTSKPVVRFLIFCAIALPIVGFALWSIGPGTAPSSGPPASSSSQFTAGQPRGIWTGQSRTVDQGVVRNSSITVDFDQHIASDGECPENRGRLISVDADTITIEWGQCGREVVKCSMLGANLSAEGATVDIAGNRSNKRTWTLTQQRA